MAAIVGILLAMAWTTAMATPLHEAIPFYPQLLLVY